MAQARPANQLLDLPIGGVSLNGLTEVSAFPILRTRNLA
jgi:hypothetical protein